MKTSGAKRASPSRISPRSASAPALITFALVAMLALSACSSSTTKTRTRTVTVGAAADSRVSLANPLAPREERGQSFQPVPTGVARSITRTPRTGPAGHQKLAIRTDPVAFASGKRVGGASGGLRATDELPLRAVTLRAAGRHPIKVQGDDGTPTAYSNSDGVLESSLQLSAGGATLKFGGEGVVYYDMQRQFNYFNAPAGPANHDAWWRYGPDGKLGDASAAAGGAITASHARDLGLSAAGGTLTAAQAALLQGYVADNAGACWQMDLSVCGDWAHDDLAIAFGAPAQSPQGEPAYYWKVRAPFTAEQRRTGLPGNFGADDDGRAEGELGTYELWLSHYAGADDKGTPSKSDDTHRYLEYAAYGLFTFFDNVVQTPNFLRPHAFATGYDAFQDSTGMRTTDVATSIEATFTGHTSARRLIGASSATHVVITGHVPIRGDVTLNACIGAGTCSGSGIPTTANTISGLISGLEELRHDGAWIPLRYGNIRMREGAIQADGSFGGLLTYPYDSGGVINSWDYTAAPLPPGVPNDVESQSKYGGNFYGPRGAGMEAAGWWHMRPDDREAARLAGRSSIIGSFGAKCTGGCE